jgi:hypothetical protein
MGGGSFQGWDDDHVAGNILAAKSYAGDRIKRGIRERRIFFNFSVTVAARKHQSLTGN